MVWNSFHACLPCFYLSLIAQTCPNLPKIAFTLFFHCLNKKMWLQKVLALLSLALVISLIQCTGVCWEVALEPIELPFILSGVCSPSEANYFSNPFEVFCWYSFSRNYIHEFFLSKVSKRLRLMWQRVKNKQKFLNQVIC